MTEQHMKTALTGLRWTLGIVILIQAIMFVEPGAERDFARTHMPNVVRLVLGWGEIAGCILLLIPETAIKGAWVLLAVFGLAIIIHLLHGMFGVGNLVVYASVACTLAIAGRGSS